MQITIYHNPKCSTSRNALAAIRAAGYEPRVFEYLETPLSRGALAALVKGMNVPVRDVVRTKEPLFRDLGLDAEDIGEDDLLDAMAQHPILLNRPIVVVQNGRRTVIRLCRPAETVKSLIEEERTKN